MNLKINCSLLIIGVLFILVSSNANHVTNEYHVIEEENVSNYVTLNEKMEILREELKQLKGELHQLKVYEEKFPLVDNAQTKLNEEVKQLRENVNELKENDVFTEIMVNENRQAMIQLQAEVKHINASFEAKHKHGIYADGHRHSINLNERLEAEHFNFEQKIDSRNSCPDPNNPNVRRSYVTPKTKDAVIGYYKVDFGLGPRMVELRVASGVGLDTTGNIQLRLNSPNNAPFATIPIRSTLGPCEFFIINSFIPTSPKGVHNLYVTFDSAFNGPLVNIDWMLFK